MKDLKKISEVIRNTPKNGKSELERFPHFKGEKTRTLLSGIMSESFQSDVDASNAIYEKPDKSKKNYLMLKSRLKKRMIEETFFINPVNKKRSPYESHLNDSYRKLSIAKGFLSAGLRQEAMEIVKTLFQEALHFRFTEIILSTARMLRYHASLQGTRKELESYDTLIEETKKELAAEILSDKIIEEMNLEARFSYSNRRELVKVLTDQYARLKSMAATHRSHTLQLNTFRIGIRYNEYIQDFNGMISVCEACEKYLDDNPQFRQDSRYAEMALFKMDACLHLQDYVRGREYASVCISYFRKGYPNWFVFMECYFLLCLQTRNYEASIAVFREVTKHAKFRNVNPERKEKWKLFEAYLNFVVPAGLADKNFRLYKFVNEVPIYNRDKKGYNVSILIAQFILLLNMGDHDRLALKRDSFRLYFKRYVKRKFNYRSYYFSKMLMTVLRYNFNPEKTRKIAQKFLLHLKTRKGKYHGDLETLEVIPYEQLWNEVLHRLEVNNKGSRYFISPVAKPGRVKKIPSRNLLAALRYKSSVQVEAGQA